MTKFWAVLAVAMMSGAALALDGPSAEMGDGMMTLRVGEQPVAVYVWSDPELPRPYFKDLRTVTGVPVSRNYPPVEGQDPTDHATYHPGLWMAFGDINGADFWRNKARVEHVRFVEEPSVSGSTLRFAVENRYLNEGTAICTDSTTYTLTVAEGRWTLGIDAAFSPVGESMTFGDQEEMGLGVRVATPVMVKNDGRIINSDGKINEPEVWGQVAEWADYSTVTYGERYGVVIIPDPRNFRPSWFHARDYGLLVANPFGNKAFTDGEASAVTVKKGEDFHLRFRVVVYEGDAAVLEHGPVR